MCGIAGFVRAKPDGRGGSRGILERMTETIRHRGPDAEGYYEDDYAWLGHRRLSIVDLTTGAQPMFNETGSLVIVYNGEIFNHALVRPELERAGHRFRSDHSDTEAIIHAWEEWGARGLEHFRGMFAFALWDRDRRRLYCARDRLGIKPFYYYWDGSLFAFASEIKALFEHPQISAEFDESTLGEYLTFGYISDERTLFKGIRKLMPGHHLTLDAEAARLAIEQYWDVPPPATDLHLSDAEWISETRRRLEETVRMRLMSDVPLGMFLSGGVDSSAIAALIKRMVTGPVKTFAVGYAEQQYSELSYAAQVARSIGTEHHEVRVGFKEFFEALPQLIWHEDEPITWPSSVSLHFVSRLAAQQVTVVLTGEGSDEQFAGYERYRWNLLNLRAAGAYSAVPDAFRRAIRNWVSTSGLLGATTRRKLKHTFLGCEDSIEALYLDNFYSAFSGLELQHLLRADLSAPYTNYLRHWNAREGASPLSRMLYADQKTYLVELLMKQDQMSMSCSIESRVPFLDHHFVAFAASIPDRLKIRGRTLKYVLKKAVEDILPPEIIHREKMGFPTPIRHWLLRPEAQFLYDALLDRDGFAASYLNLGAVDELIRRHTARQEDATDRLWRLLNLQVWGDLFITGRRKTWRDRAVTAAVKA